MKQFFILLLLFVGVGTIAQVNYTANDQLTPYTGIFRPGINPSFYPNWTSEQVADVAAGNPLFGVPGIGAKTLRTAMSDDFVTQFGYDYLLPTYSYYGDLGLTDLTTIVGFPHPSHQESTIYCTDQNIQSTMFEGLYEPIWDGGANGTPYNDDNLFAAYMYEITTRYTPYVKFWEIWNEPGLDYTGNCGWREPGDPSCNWWDQDPDPCDYKLRAPVQSYVRTLRIAYEVIKTVSPDDYVVVAGVGFESFLDAILRNTDNPNGGSVTADYPNKGGAYFDVMGFHSYPHFDGTTIYYDNNIGGLAYERHSDRAAFGIPFKQTIRQGVLGGYGYDGVTYPAKEWIITEINIPRDPVGGQWIGSEDAQKNYIIKAMVNAMKFDINQIHTFRLGEREYFATANNGQTGNPEFNLMGLYQRMDDILPYEQVINIEGIAHKTASDCLFGSTYDATETAQMNLPAGVDGGAFLYPDGHYTYVVWAKTTVDLSESASATYSFPNSFGFSNVYKKDWDFSQTLSSSQIGASGINLTATPIFLTEEEYTPPPVITLFCPDDVTVVAGQNANGAVVNYPQPNVTTTCSSGLSTSLTGGLSSGSVFSIGTTLVEFEATDDCGNVVICSFNVTVQAPLGGCPDNINGFTLLGEYNDHKYFISDEVSRPTDAQISAQIIGGHLAVINDQGENDFIQQNITELVYIGLNDAVTEDTPAWVNSDLVTYTNYDNCAFCTENNDDDDYVVMHSWNGGWSWSNQFNKRLFVVELPCDGGSGTTLSISCPSNQILTIPNGSNSIAASWNQPTTSGDCNTGLTAIQQTAGPNNGASLSAGIYTVSYTATDGCGNTANCSFTITVHPFMNQPVLEISCPANQTLMTSGVGATVQINWADPIITNICPTSGITLNQSSGPSNGSNVGAGNYTIQYIVTNNCGFTNSCFFTITITDGGGGNDCPGDIVGFTSIGEFNGHKYYLSNDIARPTDAQAVAQANDGYLVSINSLGENDFIQQNVSDMVYIGLNDFDTEGDLVWANGDPLTYNNVDPCGFCEENSSDLDFVIMQPWDGGWSFSNFWNSRLYVMEVDCDGGGGNDITITCPASFEVQADASGFGLVEFTAASASTTCPSGGLSVTQSGGITSGSSYEPGDYLIEYTATDGCGNTTTCSFKVDVIPNNLGGCEDDLSGYTYIGQFGSSSYFLSDAELRAGDAQAAAAGLGGHLVTINSQAENDFLQPAISGVVYIGLHDENTEGSTEWFNGENVDYTNFDICNFCNENSDDMDYAIMHSWNGGWSWSNFWNRRQYIVEVPCVNNLNNGTQSLITIPSAQLDLESEKPSLERVIPNPGVDYIFAKINSSREEDIDIQIFDARGTLVKTVNVSLYQGKVFREIDINDLPNGLYYMNIPQGQKLHSQVKFVKQGL